MRKKKGAQEISNEVLCAEYEAVYHYALSICRNETEAQDLTQETFLKAMNAVESFKGNSSLYTWLCAIAKNLWINRCKKQSREIIPENIAEMGQDDQPSIEQQVADKETAIETSTMVRTDDNSLIVIQFTYTSDNGNGIYGFEYQKDNYGNYGLVRHGEDVTIDNLVNAE